MGGHDSHASLQVGQKLKSSQSLPALKADFGEFFFCQSQLGDFQINSCFDCSLNRWDR